MASPLLARPGAVPADPPDAGVASHYGDPLREQKLLARGEAMVDLSHFGVVRVTGPDRLPWLHSLTTQHLSALPPGAPTEALVLSPHGHVEHHLRVVDDGAATWLVVEPGTAAALVEFLSSMRFLLRVEVADVTADWAVVRSFAGLDGRVGTGVEVRRVGDFALVPRASLVACASAAGALAGVAAYDALRVAAGEPRLGRDTDHRTIPNEVGWIERAVHLDKGCYRGQETVARVHNLGRPPRRLVRLHLDGVAETLPATGTAVELDTGRVGFVGTAVRHFELGAVALALVKRTVPVDAVLRVGPSAAAQDVLVSPDAGLGIRARL
ncbi:MAG TPA: folate-binding protein [Mycobacteriales bacterium]|nr:folate-binding protein [Mycobacteriales bacterium]